MSQLAELIESIKAKWQKQIQLQNGQLYLWHFQSFVTFPELCESSWEPLAHKLIIANLAISFKSAHPTLNVVTTPSFAVNMKQAQGEFVKVDINRMNSLT